MAGNLHRVHVLHAGGAGLPARLRVLLVHYEPWWEQRDLLLDGSGFFVQVLREAVDGDAGRPGGPLGEAISLEQALDTLWVEANAHRFVQRVERVAVRNHPVDDALVAFYRNNYDSLDNLNYTSTFNSRYRPDEFQPLEERLVQADYEVWVTDPRWIEPLQTGQCWGTEAWGPLTTAGAASERLGFVLWARNDRDGAVAAFRRAIELGDARTKVEAQLELDQLLHKGTDWRYDPYQVPRAALELCVRLHSEGRREEARAAYSLAVLHGGASVIAEARRRVGMESPAEYGHRLAEAGELSRAAAELRAAYDDGSAYVASFGLALYERDFARAERLLGNAGGDLVISWCGQVAIDLAFLHARAGDTDTARTLMDLITYDSPASLFSYALESGSAHPAEIAMEIGTELIEGLVNPAWDDGVEEIVEATRHRLPELAASACRLQAACEAKYGQHEGTARWSQRLAEIETSTATDQ